MRPSGVGPSFLPALLRAAALLLLSGILILHRDGGEPEGRLDLPEPLLVSIHDVKARGWTPLLLQAAEGSLMAAVSGDPPPLLLERPRRLRADRASALRMRATEAVQVRLDAPVDTPRTVTLEAGEEASFLLRPRSSGWATWHIEILRTDRSPEGGEERPGTEVRSTGEVGFGGEVRAASLTQEWSAWVEPPRPLRILALSGPPGPESQFAVRALEESGENVELWTHLGRGLWIGREEGEGLPDEALAYSGVDVILLFPGLLLSSPEANAIAEAVRIGGTGLLLAATDSGSPELLGIAPDPVRSTGWGTVKPIAGDALEWIVPPEVRPLPPLDLSAQIRAPATATPPATPLTLSVAGRGRIGALALTDTWAWRMEAGAEDAHRAFWRSVVDWLSDGFSWDPALEILAEDVRVGELVRTRWLSASLPPGASGPPTLHVSGPRQSELLVLPRLRDTGLGSESVGTFVPDAPGGYHLTPMDPEGDGIEGSVLEGVPLGGGAGRWVRGPEAGSLDPEGRLARLAVASHGGGVEFGGALADPPRGSAFPEIPWTIVLFGMLTVLFSTEWALRRLGGRP